MDASVIERPGSRDTMADVDGDSLEEDKEDLRYLGRQHFLKMSDADGSSPGSLHLNVQRSFDSEKAHALQPVTFREMLKEMESIAFSTGARDTTGKRDHRCQQLADGNANSPGDPDASAMLLPDRGVRAWATVVAAHLLIFNVRGWNGAFGVFQNYYSADLLRGTSPALISWIGSLQLFFTLFMGTIVGRAVDAGYWRASFNGGSACLVIFTVLTSFCRTWWQIFLAQGIASGLAMGMMLCTVTLILRSYFSKRLALAIGLGASGSCTGGIVYTLLARELLPRIGFGWTMRIIALVMLCLLVPVNLFVRMGPGLKKVSAPLIDWSAFRDVPYLLLMLGLFFCFWGVYFGFYYIVSFGVDILHLDQDAATDLLVYLNVANFFGRILPNLLSDAWFGPLNTLIPSMALSATILFLWIGSKTSATLIAIACCYGLTSGSLQSLFNAATISFVPDMSRVGVRLGMVFTAVSFGGLTGAPVGGWLIQARGGSYLYAQIFAGTTIAVGAILLLIARILKKGCGLAKL